MAETNNYRKAITGITVAFIVILLIFAWRIFTPRPQLTEIKISLSIPSDSLKAAKISDETLLQLKELSEKIANQEEELKHYYDFFIKAREDDADMLKILSIIGAMIIALGTFFGLSNLKEFKEKISQDTQKLAADKVTLITNKTLKSRVSDGIRKSLDNDIFYRDLKSRIQEDIVTVFLPSIQEDIENLKKKISRPSSDDERETDNTANGTEEVDIPMTIPEEPEDD